MCSKFPSVYPRLKEAKWITKTCLPSTSTPTPKSVAGTRSTTTARNKTAPPTSTSAPSRPTIAEAERLIKENGIKGFKFHPTVQGYTLLKDRILFGSDYPLITPERWMKDFEDAGFRPR